MTTVEYIVNALLETEVDPKDYALDLPQFRFKNTNYDGTMVFAREEYEKAATSDYWPEHIGNIMLFYGKWFILTARNIPPEEWYSKAFDSEDEAAIWMWTGMHHYKDSGSPNRLQFREEWPSQEEMLKIAKYAGSA